MVRVPQVDLPSVGVNAGALPQFQAGQVVPVQNLSGQGLAQLGQGLEQAGAGLLRLQDRINDSRARAADTEFSEWSRAAVSEYRNKKGYDAIQAREQIVQDLKTKQKELAEGLDNQWQREAFEQRASNRSLYFGSMIDDHFVGQSTAYEIGQTKAALDANISDYTESFSSPVTITDMQDSPFYQDAMRNVATLMQAQGVQPGSPMWKQAEKSVETQMHVNTLASLAQSQDPASRQMARDYFKQHGSSIPTQERGKIETAIRKMNVDDIAFSSSQQLLTAYPDDLQSQIQTLDALRSFGGIDEEEYSATLGKLTQRFNSNQTAKAQQRDALRTQYEESLRGAIGQNQDWSAWETGNAAMVSQLKDLGMYDEAVSYWSNKGRFTTTDGEARMMEYLTKPEMLLANGDPAAKWLEIRSKMAPALSPADLQKVEAAFISANRLDLNGRSPSGRGRAGDVVKIVDDKEFYNSLVAKLVGEEYDEAWERKVDKGRTIEGNPAKRQLWLNARLKLESDLNKAGIDQNDRQAITDYVNKMAASQPVQASASALGFDAKPISGWMSPLVYEQQTSEERAGIKWQQPVEGAAQPITLTLGEWTGNAELRQNVRSLAQEQLKKYREEAARSPAPALQEAIDTLTQAIQDDVRSGDDLTRVGGGTDTLIRLYLRNKAMQSAQEFSQRQAMSKIEARARNEVSDAASRTNIRQLVRTYMGDVIPSKENLQAMLDAYTQQAIEEGVFGPAESFDDSVLGAAKKRAATEAVRRELYEPTVTELSADRWRALSRAQEKQAAERQAANAPTQAFWSPEMQRIMSEAESRFPQERAALRKQLEEQAAANRKAQKEKEAARLKEALQKRRDSMK